MNHEDFYEAVENAASEIAGGRLDAEQIETLSSAMCQLLSGELDARMDIDEGRRQICLDRVISIVTQPHGCGSLADCGSMADIVQGARLFEAYLKGEDKPQAKARLDG